MRLIRSVVVLLVLPAFCAAAWAGVGGSHRKLVPRATSTKSVVIDVAATPSTGSELASSLGARTITPIIPIVPGSILPSVVLKDPISGPGALGTSLVIEGLRGVSKAGMAKAIARALPVIGTAVTIADMLEDIRCRQGGASAGPECDSGSPEESFTGTHYRRNGGTPVAPWVRTREAACQQWASYFQASAATQTATCGGVTHYHTPTYTSVPSGSACLTTWTSLTGTCTTTTSSNTHPLSSSTQTTTQCPAAVINGVSYSAGALSPGPDGKCPTGIYAASDVIDVEAKLLPDDVWQGRPPATVMGELESGLVPVDTVDPDPTSLTGPTQAAPSHRETTVQADGSTTVKDTSYPITYNNNSYSWTTITNTRTYAPGATVPPLEQPDAGNPGTTTTGTPTEIITCGLPTTPPCKIDEGGTPPPSDPFAGNDPSSWFSSLPIENPEVADTSWTWSFAMPSSCSAVTIGPFITKFVTVDLCQWQPMIHDIMSLVWLATTVWVCIGMLGVALRG